MLERGWELRYERECLKGEGMSSVSNKYKEGIVWVYRYYKGERVERRWNYGKEYGPTMKELYKVIKETEESLEEEIEIEEEEISKEENLKRIMPSPNEPQREFIWAYKRYMWEAGIL
jgi:5'-3' exonuclease